MNSLFNTIRFCRPSAGIMPRAGLFIAPAKGGFLRRSLVKRGTPSHPKMSDLAYRLSIPRHAAVGLMEMLWHFTARYTPQGDIGKYSNAAIAKELDWQDAPDTLINGLVSAGWLEEHTEHRLIVHDWEDHADQTVSRYLKNHNLSFIQSDASMKLANTSLGLENNRQPKPVPKPVPKPKKERAAPLDFPEELNNPEFKKTWKDWIGYRKEIKHPLKDSTVKRQWKMLAKFGVADAMRMIEKSITNGWTGLFPVDKEPQKSDPLAVEAKRTQACLAAKDIVRKKVDALKKAEYHANLEKFRQQPESVQVSYKTKIRAGAGGKNLSAEIIEMTAAQLWAKGDTEK